MIAHEVLRAIRPDVSALTMLLPLFPDAFVLFAIGVVQYPVAVALIQLELALIGLAIRPHISACTMLFAQVEVAVVEPAVRPLVQAFALHDIVDEWTLVDLTPRRDTATIAIDLALLVEALKHRVIRVYLEPHPIWLESLHIDLTSVLGATPPLLKVHLEHPLHVQIVIKILMREVIKWPENFVDVPDRLVSDLRLNIVVVGQRKIVIQTSYVAIQALSHINHDFLLGFREVLDDHGRLRQVNVEVIQALLQILDLVAHSMFLMEKLNQAERLQFLDQLSRLELKIVHL